MITKTGSKILGYIRTHKQARPHDLVRVFGISQVAVHKQLNNLLNKGEVTKVGKPPLVFYVPKEKKEEISTDVPDNIKKTQNSNWQQ